MIYFIHPLIFGVSMRKYLQAIKNIYVVGAMTIIACTPNDIRPEKTYVVTCRFPTETTVDTIVTRHNVWHLKTSYRIDNVYYPTAFCIVRYTINENR